jgi:hypothetical protein
MVALQDRLVAHATLYRFTINMGSLSMNRITFTSLAAAIAIFASHAASAAPLATWTFADNDGVVDSSDPSVTTTTFTGTPSGTGSSDLKIINFDAQGGSSSTSVTGSTPYWEVTLSGTRTLTLDQLVFGARVFQQAGLRNGFVEVRVDTGSGFGSALPPSPFAVTADLLSSFTVELGGFVILPGQSYITRFYLLNNPTDQAPDLQARLALDNVQFNGSVPLPSSIALVAAAGLGFMVMGSARRRRSA